MLVACGGPVKHRARHNTKEHPMTMRPSATRLAAVLGCLRSMQSELIWEDPLVALAEMQAPASFWSSLASAPVYAVDALNNPEHESELHDYLADLRQAVAAKDLGTISWHLDEAIAGLERGDLWPQKPAEGCCPDCEQECPHHSENAPCNRHAAGV